MAAFLTFATAGFQDPTAFATGTFDYRTIGGKAVDVAAANMLFQDEHQQGSAYIYLPETENRMYIVITDDETWAADALSQLP